MGGPDGVGGVGYRLTSGRLVGRAATPVAEGIRMVGRRRLRESADELLAAWCPPGSERTHTDFRDRTWIEYGTAPARERFHPAYGQLLWEVVTSPASEVVASAARFHEQPYINSPPPLQVAVWRLVGLEADGGVEQLRAATTGIVMYCDPEEEHGAAGGVRARIRSLGG